MILQALTDYYDRLEADPDQNVANFGFSREKISFCVVLQPDGTPVQIDDIRQAVEIGGKTKRTRQVPRSLIVPDRGGRSGTLIKTNFLWDNTGYALGCDGKGKPERSRSQFEAFRTLHKEFLAKTDDTSLTALCRFLDAWDVEQASQRAAELARQEWDEICDANIVFRLDGQRAYVHDSQTLRDAWLTFVTAEYESQPGYCLVSGKEERLARLHPMIRGVAGAQSSGAALASFNKDAFTSYGKEQSYNAPVGLRAAFRYTTALNRLVSDLRHRVRVAGSTIVYWSDKPTPFESMFGPTIDDYAAEDTNMLIRVQSFWDNLRQGRAAEDMEDAEVGFHVLGISPNASRLSIRFWLTGTVGEFAERLGSHLADLEMGYPNPNDPPLTVRRMLDQTVRDRKDISQLLEGSLVRAILTGGPYPQTLFNSVIRRIVADGRVTHHRAAILKAFLVRSQRPNEKEDIPVTLNVEHPNQAYHLGRLFAALEKTQEEASDGKLNSTIKDRYFSSASTTPVVAFSRLLRLHAHHLKKIENPGRRTNLEKIVQEVCSHIDGFPNHLPLDGQGLFFIGYYHQRQDFFTKKTDSSNATPAQESNV